MCLPSIIEVAEKAGVELNPRTLNKKEVYAKCPFCLGDTNRKGKYKLSLNQNMNVFKCWLCGEHGGVLEFESKLTGLSFEEVKVKYFGQKKKDVHPVEKLSPMQLRKIGWAQYKRQNRDDFMKKRAEVIRDWKNYEREEKVKYFAMLMVIAHLENQEERQKELFTYLAKACGESPIDMLFSVIFGEYLKETSQRADWAIEGTEIARSAWKVSLKTLDFDFEQVSSNTIMCFYLSKLNKYKPLNDRINLKSS